MLLWLVIVVAVFGFEIQGSTQDIFVAKRALDFHHYLNRYAHLETSDYRMVIPAGTCSYASAGVSHWEDPTGTYNNALYTGEDDTVEWRVYVEEDGLYNIAVTYYPVPGRRSSIQREIYINGELPYEEAGFIEFHRVWGDGGLVQVDNQGNEIRPSQVEIPEWRTVLVADSMGTYSIPLSFYLKRGWNTIALVSRREPVVIGQLEILSLTEHPSYAEVEADYKALGFSPTSDILIKIQGEDAVRRSSPSLFPLNDRSDPLVEPYHHTLIRLNTIGGERWSRPGDWIEWEFEVPESGLYQIAIKAKQHVKRGSYSSRRLLIDGRVPFKEGEAVQFPYSSRYEMMLFGDEETGTPYLVYLEKGKHTLRLENVLGELAEIVRATQESLYELNTVYRRIVMITSANPDPMRDYRLEERIPGLISALERQSRIIGEIAEDLKAIIGESGAQVAVLEQLSRSLWLMADRPFTIPRRLAAFRDNAGALGTWILETREQPLQIDYIVIASPNVELPKTKPHVGQVMLHELRAFLSSFVYDYTLVGNVYSAEDFQVEPLRVWIGSGRDQAQILKLMIEDTFTPETGIPVNLELINIGILLPATLAGRGPDVALGVQDTQPMDFALRGAAVDLTQFPDFPEVAERFHPSALVPYSFGGSVYGLPETQTFSMLFYRKDILEELGLEVPQTWDDVIKIIPDLNKDHMDFGLPYSGIAQASSGAIGEGSATVSVLAHGGVSTFLTLLFQRGEDLYLGDGIATNLESEAAVQAFTQWTELYELYDLPLWYDAANRFRMGEMPILVQDFGFYNFLQVFAPELRGEWDFTLIPGTERDGIIDRSVPVSGPACMILSAARNKEHAWEFVKWWTSTETQVRFGQELESILGPAARYASANLEAVSQLPWTVEEYQLLEEQRSWAKGVPNVPGAYMVGRHLDNAFRRVIYYNEPARDTLLDYNRVINEEITVKREEFDLEVLAP